MNEYTLSRLKRVQNILQTHAIAIKDIIEGNYTDLEAAQELSLLLNTTEQGGHFKFDCKEAEIELYRSADKEGLVHE